MPVYAFLLLQSAPVPPKLQKYHSCRENKVSMQAMLLQLFSLAQKVAQKISKLEP